MPNLIRVTLPLMAALLSTVSLSAQAQLNRHIADPLNLKTSLGIGFDADVFKVGGRLGGESQKIELHTNMGGDKWTLSYLYAPASSGNNLNISAKVNHGKTDTEIGRLSHYQYQFGVISEYVGWYETLVFTELAANYLSIDEHSSSNSFAANASFSVLKPWSDRWYNQLTTQASVAIDGRERFEGEAWLSLGYRLSEQWSWEVRYRYEAHRIDEIEYEDTQWVFALQSQF
ncbi:hypothetical protein [Shewanella nanhaiensis]|uniref:DUF481 domain-containing protein n=1 Tax=Shewanella nanhaiensis TaxID=2864872 RepID=A0ABS7E5E0_9GAMM|nr:hypothetical protein [Shewanella nanhaiensis]MBW8184845.1 hypothetical protein [Shewanella nanhaiensis]